MKIVVNGSHYKIEFDSNLDTNYEFDGISNPFVVRDKMLEIIEERFNKEVANLLEKGSFSKYK